MLRTPRPLSCWFWGDSNDGYVFDAAVGVLS